MNIGIPKEIKPQEYRVAATPGAVHALTSAGHRVVVETGAGLGSSFPDEEYLAAGAELGSVSDAWGQQLVLKVKEPIEREYGYLRPDLLLFTYLHLAADRPLTDALVTSRTTAVAYETVQLPNGTLPLLTPMSEVAGRMAPQVGAHFLERAHGGKGVLLAGVPGVQTGVVTIIGAGVVGTNAAKISLGLGARVNLLDVSHARLQYLDDVFGGRVQTMASNLGNLRELLPVTDLLIGAVLIPGARAPRLVTRDMLALMKPGSVIVDVAVDQGGCIETIHATTHESPTYVVDGVVHYGVANMPGAVPNTSTRALSNQTLPYALRLAAKGLTALQEDPAFLKGLNTHAGAITYGAVGQTFGLEVVDPATALRSGGVPA
ncbi:MAG: alanine dehydrogenase [Trueperaceae bacterium]|nr:alanine dehydrogenase [Trueperaceae bacterium]MCC6311999.1 alanine dehydrogenase [Trueperaceae bacterium]MCO5174731.1 alanine dehydrogenase [Trueperaceae bacterium]MCW5821041.1 alanine dehydrogenase [Trueperaceae bacterium]